MLIDKETESRIMRLLRSVGDAYSVYLMGREIGQTIPEAFSQALASQRLNLLDQAFYAGKMSSVLTPDDIRGMSQDELISWVRDNNVILSDHEQATLRQLKNDTQRWMEGRTEEWQQRFRASISNADKDWRSVIMAERFQDAGEKSDARIGALDDLMDELKDGSTGFTDDMDRLLHTEMSGYFQHGQVADTNGEDYVYKIAADDACDYCIDLHTDADGSPIMYRMDEVAGNSNIGVPAYAWEFTIGPVHPYCYCVLYNATQADLEESGTVDEELKKSLRERKRNRSRGWIPQDPYRTFNDMLRTPKKNGEKMPAHQAKIIAAVRQIYGDDPPF
jgi:hypothetical protein